MQHVGSSHDALLSRHLDKGLQMPELDTWIDERSHNHQVMRNAENLILLNQRDLAISA
jgi:hypothetical protein